MFHFFLKKRLIIGQRPATLLIIKLDLRGNEFGGNGIIDDDKPTA